MRSADVDSRPALGVDPGAAGNLDPDVPSGQHWCRSEVTTVEITTIEVLAGQRAVLEAAPGERNRLFRERVVEPLRPFWGPDGRADAGLRPGRPALHRDRAGG